MDISKITNQVTQYVPRLGPSLATIIDAVDGQLDAFFPSTPREALKAVERGVEQAGNEDDPDWLVRIADHHMEDAKRLYKLGKNEPEKLLNVLRLLGQADEYYKKAKDIYKKRKDNIGEGQIGNHRRNVEQMKESVARRFVKRGGVPRAVDLIGEYRKAKESYVTKDYAEAVKNFNSARPLFREIIRAFNGLGRKKDEDFYKVVRAYAELLQQQGDSHEWLDERIFASSRYADLMELYYKELPTEFSGIPGQMTSLYERALKIDDYNLARWIAGIGAGRRDLPPNIRAEFYKMEADAWTRVHPDQAVKSYSEAVKASIDAAFHLNTSVGFLSHMLVRSDPLDNALEYFAMAVNYLKKRPKVDKEIIAPLIEAIDYLLKRTQVAAQASDYVVADILYKKLLKFSNLLAEVANIKDPVVAQQRKAIFEGIRMTGKALLKRNKDQLVATEIFFDIARADINLLAMAGSPREAKGHRREAAQYMGGLINRLLSQDWAALHKGQGQNQKYMASLCIGWARVFMLARDLCRVKEDEKILRLAFFAATRFERALAIFEKEYPEEKRQLDEIIEVAGEARLEEMDLDRAVRTMLSTRLSSLIPNFDTKSEMEKYYIVRYIIESNSMKTGLTDEQLREGYKSLSGKVTLSDLEAISDLELRKRGPFERFFAPKERPAK